MIINYIKGDATYPQGDGLKIIPHICNDENKWGAGFVLAVSKRWKSPEIEYRKEKNYKLGNVQFVKVSPDIIVANMIAQHGIGRDKNGNPPIRYDALRTALISVDNYAIHNNATVHAPKFGTGLAGGDWNVIEQIIKDTLTVEVTIYDFN